MVKSYLADLRREKRLGDRGILRLKASGLKWPKGEIRMLRNSERITVTGVGKVRKG